MTFNRSNRPGGGQGFGRRRFDGDRNSDRQMFKTTCSDCKKECEVPFRPTGNKPVYCNNCFRNMGGSDSRHTDNRGSKPNFDNRDRYPAQPQYKEQFEALNTKLDKILKLLNSEKPVETTPKVVVEPQIKNTIGEEIVAPVKKRTRTKKLVLIQETAEPQTVTETPTEVDISTKIPTE
ncbi:hypothetical protein C4577_01130 [Candidatus Parcubacteria bacterium]|nr:MAG: hypothetical protein C4577_01130 [Candidatus Parcubacteria bacterium]